MKAALIIAAWVLGLTAFVALMAFAQHEEGKTTVREIVVELDQPAGQLFINKDDVLALLLATDDSLQNRALQAINTNLLEETLTRNHYIAGAEVFSTLDGTLSVHVKQKQAVARVLAPTKHFYLDAEGHPYPTTVNYSAYVPTLSGRTDSASIYHAYSVLQEINTLPYFKNWLAEIHTTAAGNIQLIPATGNHRVLFGSAANAAEKLKMLEAFYTTVVTPENLNDWKTLNVAYQGQLVTTKYSM